MIGNVCYCLNEGGMALDANSDPLEDIKQVAGLGAIMDLDEIADDELKELYARLLAWAYARVFVNSKREGHERWRNMRVWVCMDGARTAKSITTKNWTHIVVNAGLIEQLVWDAYRIGHNPDVFSWMNGNAAKLPVAVTSRFGLAASSPEDLIQNLGFYKISDERRGSLALVLLAVGFLFVIDHEYCHISHHHAYLNRARASAADMGSGPPAELDFLTKQALEHDADIFATNRWTDMLLGRDCFLDHGDMAAAIAALREQDRSATYVLFIYAMFCGFRGMGQENWSASFPSTTSHPPAPFRFKSTLACLYERLEQLNAPAEMNAFRTLGKIIWPLLEFLYSEGSKRPSIKGAVEDVSSAEADTHFRALYARWREIVLSGAISGWEGVIPPEY